MYNTKISDYSSVEELDAAVNAASQMEAKARTEALKYEAKVSAGTASPNEKALYDAAMKSADQHQKFQADASTEKPSVEKKQRTARAKAKFDEGQNENSDRKDNYVRQRTAAETRALAEAERVKAGTGERQFDWLSAVNHILNPFRYRGNQSLDDRMNAADLNKTNDGKGYGVKPVLDASGMDTGLNTNDLIRLQAGGIPKLSDKLESIGVDTTSANVPDPMHPGATDLDSENIRLGRERGAATMEAANNTIAKEKIPTMTGRGMALNIAKGVTHTSGLAGVAALTGVWPFNKSSKQPSLSRVFSGVRDRQSLKVDVENIRKELIAGDVKAEAEANEGFTKEYLKGMQRVIGGNPAAMSGEAVEDAVMSFRDGTDSYPDTHPAFKDGAALKIAEQIMEAADDDSETSTAYADAIAQLNKHFTNSEIKPKSGVPLYVAKHPSGFIFAVHDKGANGFRLVRVPQTGPEKYGAPEPIGGVSQKFKKSVVDIPDAELTPATYAARMYKGADALKAYQAKQRERMAAGGAPAEEWSGEYEPAATR